MSTKNLARTVIEAGRTSAGTWGCREANARFRAKVRVRLEAARDEAAWDRLVFPAFKKTNRFLDDKLGPAKRWLGSQVGRPWDKVRGELFSRFDTRTTAGRHVVFGHMLDWVDDDGTTRGCFGCYPDFRVDRHGILRHAPPRPRYVSPWERAPLPRDAAELERWLDGRRVGTRQEVLFWFVPTPHNAYRQHHRLAADDAALWRSLPEWFREKNDPAAPPPPLQNRG